eukprot:181266-Pyramimonas_sp.AAC.1
MARYEFVQYLPPWADIVLSIPIATNNYMTSSPLGRPYHVIKPVVELSELIQRKTTMRNISGNKCVCASPQYYV